MKANIKFKNLQSDTSGYTKMIGGIVALMILIIVGLLVYWNVVDSNSSFDETTEIFTGYSHGDNATAQSVDLDNSPKDTSNTNVTCYSSTSKTESYPTFSLSHRTVTIAAGSASNYTQVNVTYTSNMADTESGVSDMTSTVFELAPIIVLALVASVIIGVIMAFGGSNRRL